MHGIFASPRLLSLNENMHLAAHERLQDPPKRGLVVTRMVVGEDYGKDKS